ncbi:sensor histidine kinase [Funiculus sociatus]
MQVGAERIREIVNSLQHFSRLNQASQKSIDIHEALESTLSILYSYLGDEIEVVRHYGDLPPVECYPKPLNQVFMSILMNAIEAISRWSSKEKIIKLRTELVSDGETGEDFVRIAIADNGPGIAQEIQPKIFDPFFTTKDVGQGRGLGLTVSYQTIVSQHQGNLHCHSQPGQGAEFIIEIPLQQPKPLSPSKKEIGDRELRDGDWELGAGDWEDTTMKLGMEIRKTPLGKN